MSLKNLTSAIGNSRNACSATPVESILDGSYVTALRKICGAGSLKAWFYMFMSVLVDLLTATDVPSSQYDRQHHN